MLVSVHAFCDNRLRAFVFHTPMTDKSKDSKKALVKTNAQKKDVKLVSVTDEVKTQARTIKRRRAIDAIDEELQSQRLEKAKQFYHCIESIRIHMDRIKALSDMDMSDAERCLEAWKLLKPHVRSICFELPSKNDDDIRLLFPP